MAPIIIAKTFYDSINIEHFKTLMDQLGATLQMLTYIMYIYYFYVYLLFCST